MIVTVSRAGDRAGLLEQLLAVGRPEFRVDVLTPASEDRVLGVPDCAVCGCDYPVADHGGICNRHRCCFAGGDFGADVGHVEVVDLVDEVLAHIR